MDEYLSYIRSRFSHCKYVYKYIYIAPLNRSTSHDSDLDVQAGVRLTIPRPQHDPTVDRDSILLSNAPSSPPKVTTMESHLTNLASYFNLMRVPTAPSKVIITIPY